MQYFDFRKVADEAGIPATALKALGERIRREFSGDEMMYELHMLRACMAIRDGYTSLEEATQEGPPTRRW
jgi:hypothetical protein